MILLAVCVCVLATVLGDSEPQREVLLFDRADKDDNGQLTQAELQSVFLAFDVNNDNSITKAEFVTDWVTTYKFGNHIEADGLFAKADINDDQVINSKDLPGIFTFFDVNSDGQVNINEFLTQWGELKLQAVGVVVIPVDNSTTTSGTPTTLI